MSLYGLLERHRARPLLITPDGMFTSAHIAGESAKIARWLRDVGVVPGDRVVIDLHNGVGAVAALFGATQIGALVVCASPHWSVPQLEYVLADSAARALVTSDQRARQLGGHRPVLTAWDAVPPLDDVIEADPDAPALVIYTSGSSGRPRGVVHSHANLEAFATIVAGYLGNTADDRLLWLLGWNHGYGLSQLLTMCVSGGRLIVPASMLPADVVNAHAHHAATAIAHVPFGWEQLAGFCERTHRTLEGVRYVTNAGDGPPAALLARLPAILPGADIVLMYGQTECFRTTYLPAAQFAEKRGAMGYPLPGVQVDVVTEDGRPCAIDEPGELHHTGALVALGYWNAPEATAAKFHTDGTRRTLRTGDFVRRDVDGCLWYVGRSELMIKASGFRFSPREIEDALASHAAVREAAAFGVDDPSLGQAVEVALVARGEVDPAALLAHLRPVLPRYMLPRRIHLVDALPRTPNGKLAIAALRALSR